MDRIPFGVVVRVWGLASIHQKVIGAMPEDAPFTLSRLHPEPVCAQTLQFIRTRALLDELLDFLDERIG
jgi:hypothetical protein